MTAWHLAGTLITKTETWYCGTVDEEVNLLHFGRVRAIALDSTGLPESVVSSSKKEELDAFPFILGGSLMRGLE